MLLKGGTDQLHLLPCRLPTAWLGAAAGAASLPRGARARRRGWSWGQASLGLPAWWGLGALPSWCWLQVRTDMPRLVGPSHVSAWKCPRGKAATASVPGGKLKPFVLP